MNKGLFIVFEGVDGCGKSTQIKNLQRYIDKEYYYLFNNISIGCEPTDKESGKFIRRVLSKEINIDNVDVISGMFLGDRALHQEEILECIDLLNDVYICDRYIYSNVVYNSKSLEDMNYIESLNSSFIKPDLCFYIDTNINTCIERINKRNHKDIFENYDFLYDVKKKYNILCKQDKLIKIDGNQSEYDVFQSIKYHIDNYIKENYSIKF